MKWLIDNAAGRHALTGVVLLLLVALGVPATLVAGLDAALRVVDPPVVQTTS